LFSLSAGAITAGATAVALAAGAIATASGVSVAGAGGGAILGGATGGYQTYSVYRKYEEIKGDTKTLRAALKYLYTTQETLEKENVKVKNKIDILDD